MRAGQRPTIERDDLIAVGLLSIARDLQTKSRKPLSIIRHAKSRMIEHIISEKQHWVNRKSWIEMFGEDGDAKF